MFDIEKCRELLSKLAPDGSPVKIRETANGIICEMKRKQVTNPLNAAGKGIADFIRENFPGVFDEQLLKKIEKS